MIQLINEIRQKLDELEKKIKSSNSKRIDVECFPIIEEHYVNLSDGTDKDKLDRICEHIKSKGINIVPTPKDSQIVRSAIVAALGGEGMKNWLVIRSMSEGYNEEQQMKRYLLLLAHKETNRMTFGAVINRYRKAVDDYNNNNSKK